MHKKRLAKVSRKLEWIKKKHGEKAYRKKEVSLNRALRRLKL